MYQRNTHIRSFKGGQKRFSRNSRGSYSRGGFSGNRMRSMPANPDLFIKKASLCLSTEEYVAQNTFENFNFNPIAAVYEIQKKIWLFKTV